MFRWKEGGVNRKTPGLRRLTTEQSNARSGGLDTKSTLEIVRIINTEDAKVAPAVKRAIPQIAQAIDLIAAALSHGGRLIYVGTGTSGRIGALDATEIPPTYDVSPRVIQFIMAGGIKALAAATESSEDCRELGRKEMARKKPGKNDVVVGIAASGRTPFTLAALKHARASGAKTIAVTCNRNSPLGKAAHLEIVADVGPEVIAGSSRMKAGSAEKMILNILSTGAMTRLGYVYDNLMVHLRLKNSKLRERGIGIIEETTGLNRSQTTKLLSSARNSVPVALVMAKANVARSTAETALKKSKGQVRKAIAAANSRP
jgi:N-acetylmuramic acid 6-phosphate etherase